MNILSIFLNHGKRSQLWIDFFLFIQSGFIIADNQRGKAVSLWNPSVFVGAVSLTVNRRLCIVCLTVSDGLYFYHTQSLQAFKTVPAVSLHLWFWLLYSLIEVASSFVLYLTTRIYSGLLLWNVLQIWKWIKSVWTSLPILHKKKYVFTYVQVFFTTWVKSLQMQMTHLPMPVDNLTFLFIFSWTSWMWKIGNGTKQLAVHDPFLNYMQTDQCWSAAWTETDRIVFMHQLEDWTFLDSNVDGWMDGWMSL